MKKKRLLKYALVFVLTLGLVGGGVYAFATYSAADKVVRSVASSGTLANILQPEPLDGESTGRVNILVAGNSADQTDHGGAELTDSIMIASIDVKTYRISLVSIPRDLWVSYDGGWTKINAVYVEGGMSDLESVVQEVTGLTINHTVLLDYTALASLVDTLGGIDVDVYSDDSRGIYDPMLDNFTIGTGMQHINGTQALLLARARNDPTYDGRIPYGLSNGDFDRQKNQQRIVQALLEKIVSSGAIVNPSTLEELASNLSGHVTTNLSVGQLRRLYDIGKKATITSMSLQPYLTDYTSYDGQSALQPIVGAGDYAQIRAYLETEFGNTTVADTTPA